MPSPLSHSARYHPSASSQTRRSILKQLRRRHSTALSGTSLSCATQSSAQTTKTLTIGFGKACRDVLQLPDWPDHLPKFPIDVDEQEELKEMTWWSPYDWRRQPQVMDQRRRRRAQRRLWQLQGSAWSRGQPPYDQPSSCL